MRARERKRERKNLLSLLFPFPAQTQACRRPTPSPLFLPISPPFEIPLSLSPASAELYFLDIENIHVMRGSLAALSAACHGSHADDAWLDKARLAPISPILPTPTLPSSQPLSASLPLFSPKPPVHTCTQNPTDPLHSPVHHARKCT